MSETFQGDPSKTGASQEKRKSTKELIAELLAKPQLTAPERSTLEMLMQMEEGTQLQQASDEQRAGVKSRVADLLQKSRERQANNPIQKQSPDGQDTQN